MKLRNVLFFVCSLALVFIFNNCSDFKTMTDINPSGNQALQSSSGGDQPGPMPMPQLTPQPNPSNPNPAPLPSPVLQSGISPNMPNSLHEILHHDFSTKDGKGNGCTAYYPTGSQILSDPNEPSSAPYFMRNLKPAGASHGGTMVDCVHPQKGEVYYAFTWRSSNPFGGYDNGANKMVFYISNIPNSSGGAWGSHYFGAEPGKRVVNFFLQGGEVGNCHVDHIYGDCAASTSMVFLPNVDTSPVLEGQWHRVEVYFKRSSNGSSKDGILKMWVDGSLRISHNDVNTPQYDWMSIQTNHTWDGQCAMRNSNLPPTTYPNDCRPYDDYHDFGDFFVGAK